MPPRASHLRLMPHHHAIIRRPNGRLSNCLNRQWHRAPSEMNCLRTTLLSLCLCVAAAAQNTPGRISLVIVQGDGITIGLRQRLDQAPTVKVEDEDQRPVSGAAVVFALPVSGASGEFVNGEKTLSVVTGQDGLAAATGLRTNDIPGKLQIYVTASYRGLRARTLITQTIEAPPGTKTRVPEMRSSKSSGGKWKWIVL